MGLELTSGTLIFVVSNYSVSVFSGSVSLSLDADLQLLSITCQD